MSEIESSTRQLPTVVFRLGLVSFFGDVCSEMVYPIVPLFVASLGAPVAALGAIEGVAAAIVSVMKGWSGLHSDRAGTRIPYIRFGYGVSALAKPLIALATGWPFVLFARGLDRLGKGVRTTSRDALIADAVDPRDYGRAFGLHGLLDTAGAFVGVLVAAGALWMWPGIYRPIFLAAALPGAVSFLIALGVKDSIRPADTTQSPNRGRWQNLPMRYWAAVALCFVFGLANSSDTLLLLRARTSGMSALQVVLAYALYNAVFTVMSYPSGKISDRIGRWWVLGIGWAVYAAVYFGFAGAGSSGTWFLFAAYGVSIGMTTGVNKALIADLSPSSGRGAAMGAFYMISGLSALLASVAAGAVWERFGPARAFQMDAFLAVLAVCLVPLTAYLTSRRTSGRYNESAS